MKSLTETGSQSPAKWTALLLVALFATFAILTGAFVAAFAFLDPDTCWLLALGKWIVAHHQLPVHDPFCSNLYSYALAYPGGPLVQYQWLVEVLFYAVWSMGGSLALLGLLSLSVAFAYFVLPGSLLCRLRAVTLSFLAIPPAVLAASRRFLARPELFSGLILSALLAISVGTRYDDRKKILRTALMAAGLMALWSNTHMLFPVGVIVLFVHGFAQIVETALDRRWSRDRWLLLLPAILGSLATLLNPWGIGLWQYEYRLSYSEVSFGNVDHQAFDPANLYGMGFIALLIISLTAVAVSCRRWPKKLSLTGIALMVLGCFFAIRFAKLVPAGALLLIYGMAEFQARSAAHMGSADADSSSQKNVVQDFCDEVESRLRLIAGKRILSSTLIAGFVLLGTLLFFTRYGEPQLPASALNFRPPFQAIEYLNGHMVSTGRLLNEALFGSMMSWYMDKPPDLFLDGRFSMFEPKLVGDYQIMLAGWGPWRSLLDQYKIDWIFVPPEYPLVGKLADDKAWHEVYRDKDAVILTRRN